MIELRGPKPPDDYQCDGCSVPIPPWPEWLQTRCQRIVDGLWREACRIHDWEYTLFREMDVKPLNWGDLHDPEWTRAFLREKRGQADRRFRENIKTIIEEECDGWLTRAAFAWVDNVYYYGVRLFGSRAARRKA